MTNICKLSRIQKETVLRIKTKSDQIVKTAVALLFCNQNEFLSHAEGYKLDCY